MARVIAWSLFAVLALTTQSAVFAQTDEIQVYDAEIASPGVFNLTWHNNFTFSGPRTAENPGGGVPYHSINGVPEWAYGVKDWFEAGLYMPLYTVTGDSAFLIDGFKLRLLFVSPEAAKRRFFYGINLEFSYNSRHWNPDRYTAELRPILGWHLGRFDVVVNPILDSSYAGFSSLVFAPAARLAWNFSKVWTAAGEAYAEFGPLRQLYKRADQPHQFFVVLDHRGTSFTLEAGLGFGLTGVADHRVFKLIVVHDLRTPTR